MSPAPSARPRRRRGSLAARLAIPLLMLSTAIACTPPPCRGGCPPRGVPERAAVFAGVGTWVDIYDWSPTLDGTTSFKLADVDEVADAGVDVIYIQTTRWNRPEHLIDVELFKQIVARAHARGVRVVSWYLPTHADVKTDYFRLVLPIWFGADGIVWDIEDTTSEKDLATRNDRLVKTAAIMRKLYPDTPIAAAVLPPVVTDIINLKYWPEFPWRQLRGSFDAWMPMDYWTNRNPTSVWRDAARYTSENISRVRANLGDPNAVVHPIGGVADKVTEADMAGFVSAAQAGGAIGVSIYDHATSKPWMYPAMAPFQR
ncbi:MAG TPA: hypothetical protein VJM33_19075 [Microthrixaceae bacterium]|nr:hypothetical protein [Microthrixaceae bacterium]